MQGDGLLICMCVIAALALILLESTHRKFMNSLRDRDDMMQNERMRWADERRDLYSHIHAPDFQAYTNSTIRVKNAEKPKEEAEPLEFVG